MEVALSYLTDNLRSKLFYCSITKKPPKTMAELLARSTKYIVFEEVQQAKEGGQPKKEETESSRSGSEGYRREDRRDDLREDRSRRERRQKPPRSFGPRFNSYTPLNQSQARILEEVHSYNILQYPPSKTVLTHADRNKYCKFHRNFGHDTEACAALKDQLEDLARKGLLKQYLEKGRQGRAGDRGDHRRDDRNHWGNDQRHREDNTDTVAGTIHVIAGGIVRGTEADPHTKKRQIRSVMRLEHESKKPRTRQPSPQITFSDEDFAPATPGSKEKESVESPSRVMNTELVDPREREEERRPNPEGEMEAVALPEKDPTKTTKFQSVVIERIPREENEWADSLSKLASASARCGANPILKAALEAPSIDVPEEVRVVLEENNWRAPLINEAPSVAAFSFTGADGDKAEDSRINTSEGILELGVLTGSLVELLQQTLVLSQERVMISNELPLAVSNRLFGVPQSPNLVTLSRRAVPPHLQLLLSVLQLDLQELFA
ncbi:serine/threonine-protein kinase PRP4-like protein [Senna tora]|uniref:Serine/threonine-protein kinase PRP4-like protein n=1 Tax=Senna tora TaxID=362788 RepID=A0A834SXB7_9FABA|nr:serine/threonine-protein kinase PRP4-like protein [Senna tora]